MTYCIILQTALKSVLAEQQNKANLFYYLSIYSTGLLYQAIPGTDKDTRPSPDQVGGQDLFYHDNPVSSHSLGFIMS